MNLNKIRLLKLSLISFGLLNLTACNNSTRNVFDKLYVSNDFSNKIVFHENYLEQERSCGTLISACEYDSEKVFITIGNINHTDYFGKFENETTFVSSSKMVYNIFEGGSKGEQ